MDSESYGETDGWVSITFKALDTHGKGFLFKNEILEPIYDQGVQNHHTLDELIKGKLQMF